VASADVGGETHTGERFREVAGQLKQNTPQRLWPEEPPLRGPGCLFGPAAFFPPPCFPVVRSLEAAVRSSNWDSDSAADGYSLLVAPLGYDGSMLPVEGIVEATLHGYEPMPNEPIEKWVELGRWSQQVTLDCYGPSGGVVGLPFSAVANPLACARSPRRELRVKLTAPGHGTFEARIPILAATRLAELTERSP
jgi:hypothetical protein